MPDSIYIAYHFKVQPPQPGVEILMAELGSAGFESFVESSEGVAAYIQKEEWNASILDDIDVLGSKEFQISFTSEEIAQTNWNAEWEKSFKPIVVDNKCTVRAPFHEAPTTDYDIIIEPKMSFGTGHHETTHMMIQHILDQDLKDKTVLDMGCGTGILAILADMRGARHVDAIDIDNWCYLNSLENIERNNCTNVDAFEGDSSLLKNQRYDVILANINRNILLKDISTYAKHLNEKGILIVSGFYDNDIHLIENECRRHMLKLIKKLEHNNWVSLKFLN